MLIVRGWSPTFVGDLIIAPSWRFLAPRPCSPLFGIPSGCVRRPHSPHRVIWPGGPGPGASAGSVAAATASTGQPRPGSALRDRLAKAPLVGQAGTIYK